jgi:hypothetical protein
MTDEQLLDVPESQRNEIVALANSWIELIH